MGDENRDPNILGDTENHSPEPRLTIKSLVLENFKSYAGVQEIGPFHRSFSAIVGPNGSGKSNVIDAILFVFGKQAKTLRLNKVSDLIHNSEQFPNLSSARVTVNFYDTVLKVTQRVASLPRTATRNNTSKYFLNDRSAKREEVVGLLKKRGVDLDNNRFLILQFEVEQIARMKPKAKNEHEVGLLEYLEDIIGTDKYVTPIDEAYKQLEALNEERTSKLQRVKLVQKEKEGLEETKNEAEAHLNKEKEIIDKTSIKYQIERIQVELKAQKAEKKMKAIDEKLSEHKKEMEQYSSEVKAIEESFDAENKEYQKMAKALNKAKEKFTRFEREQIQIQEDEKHITTQIKKLKGGIEKAEQQISQREKALEENIQEKEECEVRAKELEDPLVKAERQLEKMSESIKEEVAPLHLKLDEQKNKLMPFQKEIDSAQGELDLANNEKNIFLSKSEAAEAKLRAATSDIESLKETIAGRGKRGKQIEKEIAQCKFDLQQKEEELESLAGTDTALMQEVGKARGKAEEVKNNLQQALSQNKIIQKLNGLKKKLPGIYGRLGNLGTIENLEKYDVAISTACTRLDNIVVSDMDTAQKCVEYLRSENLGTATFIILEKQRHLKEAAYARFAPPAHSERLFDLIKVQKEEVKLAFYFALQNTLVMKDLEGARKVAFGTPRYRVVTLEGQLIEVSGAMAGGGRPKRGGMARSVQSDVDPAALSKELEVYNKIVADKSMELHELREQYSRLELQIDQIKERQESLKKEIPRIELDIRGLTKQMQEVEARLPKLKEECRLEKEEQNKLKKLEAMVSSKEKALLKAKKAAESVVTAIAEIEEQIANAGGAKMKKQRARVQELATEIETAKQTVTKMEVAISSGKVAIKKLEASIAKDKKKAEELKKDLQEKKKRREELNEVANTVLKDREELEQLYNEKAEAMKAFRKEYEQKKKQYNQYRTVEVDLINQLEDEAKKVEEVKKETHRFAKKIDSLAKEKMALKIDEDDEVEAPPILSAEELEEYNVQELTAAIALLQQELTRLKPNLNALKEWRLKQTEFEGRKKDLDKTTEERDAKRKEYDDLRKKRLDEFMAGFNLIRKKLSEMYKMITLDDGDADLEPNDSLDPFSEGISFRVRPPKKSWKYIYNLSGGEMTLSSLALVFALHTYKPTPIYIMDEIDAALDFKNVSIVANYIKERTKNAQFLIVSLRNNMFEQADRLVGIYKTDNCTKSITINPATFVLPTNPNQTD